MIRIKTQAVKPMPRSIVLALIVAAFAQNAWCAQFDWPQWQGPDRNAVSKETGLLKEWPAEGPPLAWRVGDLGGGFSAPSIADGRIFGMSNRGGDEVVWALSETNGKELWIPDSVPLTGDNACHREAKDRERLRRSMAIDCMS